MRSTINHRDTYSRDSTSIMNTDPIPLPEFRMPHPADDKRISFVDTVASGNAGDAMPKDDTKGYDEKMVPTSAMDKSESGKDNLNFQDGTPVASIQFVSFVER